MPLYEYQCQGCGWIESDVIRKVEDRRKPFIFDCPVGCDEGWDFVPSVPQRSERVRSDERFPHVTHMREVVMERSPDGTLVPGSRRIVAKSRSHMEKLMQEHGYVHYEEPAHGGVQASVGQMPAHLKEMEDHPTIRRYNDMKASGRIPKAMVLSEAELQERFHVE